MEKKIVLEFLLYRNKKEYKGIIYDLENETYALEIPQLGVKKSVFFECTLDDLDLFEETDIITRPEGTIVKKNTPFHMLTHNTKTYGTLKTNDIFQNKKDYTKIFVTFKTLETEITIDINTIQSFRPLDNTKTSLIYAGKICAINHSQDDLIAILTQYNMKVVACGQ